MRPCLKKNLSCYCNIFIAPLKGQNTNAHTSDYCHGSLFRGKIQRLLGLYLTFSVAAGEQHRVQEDLLLFLFPRATSASHNCLLLRFQRIRCSLLVPSGSHTGYIHAHGHRDMPTNKSNSKYFFGNGIVRYKSQMAKFRIVFICLY